MTAGAGVYVDTSVVLRVLLHEPNSVGIWGQWNKAYSSALWRVEALLTHDSQLGTAARSLGFEVMGMDQ